MNSLVHSIICKRFKVYEIEIKNDFRLTVVSMISKDGKRLKMKTINMNDFTYFFGLEA